MFSEKCWSENRRRKRWLRPKQFSMSYYILRLLTNLIHNYTPPSIINEQVQCHIAQEPVLPISKTTAVAIAGNIHLSSLSAVTSFIAWRSWKVYMLRLKSTGRRLRSKYRRLLSCPSFHLTHLHHSLGPWVEGGFRFAKARSTSNIVAPDNDSNDGLQLPQSPLCLFSLL